MGGYGITEDCPGFLGHKWMDAQLEATYEGPEAVQRRQLSVTMTDELFLAQFREWIREMRLHRQRPSRHRRLRARHRHAAVAVDPPPSAEGHRCRWRQALPELAPGRDLPAGRRALLAARVALPDSRRAGTGEEGPRDPHRGRRPARPASPSSPTSATCRRRAPPAKWAASAPSWCTATTAIRRGIPKAARPATRPTTWRRWKRSSPASPAWPAATPTWSKPTARTPQSRSVRALRRPGAVRPPARAHGRLPHRLAAGQGPRRRSADQGDDSRGAGLPGMSLPDVDRQTMDVDIVCVGFGPATAGFLTRSRAPGQPDGTPAIESPSNPGLPLQVICYERADDISFGVSGVVTRARGIRASLPDLDPRADPDGRPGDSRRRWSTCWTRTAPAAAPRRALRRRLIRALGAGSRARRRAALHSAVPAQGRRPGDVARPVPAVGRRAS